MVAETAEVLSRWENFYVIVGSSAGALTGLQFVVIALISESQTTGSMDEIRAFGTPTLVHFCATLLISAVVSAPWDTISSAGFALTACGVAGVAYGIRIVLHARRQQGYKPDAEDWTWYAVLPLTGYGALFIAGLMFPHHATGSMFLVGASALLLMFIGIHNAWDTVIFVALRRLRGELDKKTDQ